MGKEREHPDRSGVLDERKRPGRYRVVVFLLASVVALQGCITQQKQVGTEGPFRGRWWNYYERGRAFADSRQWTEAEKDLRTALLTRTRDQYWPRTYGLHFTREYFPHRELGIVLYEQGRLDDAIRELETSVANRHTARAAYYLDEARRKWIAASHPDTAAPQIALTTPAEDTTGGNVIVEVTGTASDDTFVKAVSINGKPCVVPVSAKQVSFAGEARLGPGENEIVIVAEDLVGKKTQFARKVRADLDGPVVCFAESIALPGPVTGSVADVSGVAKLTVAGKDVPLSAGDPSFRVDVAKNELKPPLMFRAEDKLGNVTEGVVPVETIVLSQRLPEVGFAASDARVVRVAANVNALVLGGEVMALTTLGASLASGPKAEFEGMVPGGRYFLSEAMVGIKITSREELANATLLGGDLGLGGKSGVVRVCRRVVLDPGPNPLDLSVKDAQGIENKAAIEILGEPTAVQQMGQKLSLLVAGTVPDGANPLADYEKAALDELNAHYSRQEPSTRRFDMVARGDALKQILNEQQLSALLGDKEQRLRVGKVQPADLLLVAKVRRDAETLQIVLDASDTQTGVIAKTIDVNGKATSLDELKLLVEDLALRLEQEFPRVKGQVNAVNGKGAFETSLSARDRVRESMKLVVFRPKGAPGPGAPQGQDFDILGQATIQSMLGNEKSQAQAYVTEQGQPLPEVKVGDYVITK